VNFSLLDIAILTNNTQLASILLQHSAANLEQPQLLGLPPILAAVLMNTYSLAQILAEQGADLKQIDPHYGSNIFVLSLHEEINVPWLTYLLQHHIPLYQRNKNGLAGVDVYFQPTLFSAGWAKHGQTHKTLRKLLKPHANIIRMLFHHLISMLIQVRQMIQRYCYNVLQETRASLIKLKDKLFFRKTKPPAYTALPPAFNYFHARDALKKTFAHQKQLTKLYLSSSLALADNTNTAQGNMVYGTMTQRILESRGVTPRSNNSAPPTDNRKITTSSDTIDSSIPQELLPTPYKQNSQSENN
jgi:hypothetical protein